MDRDARTDGRGARPLAGGMIVALTVLDVCSESEPKKIFKRVAKNFSLMTAIFFAGGVVVALFQNWISG